MKHPDPCRFLVIGSGIGGLQSALLVAEHGTTRIITKKESTESNTNYAQGGIAAVVSPTDDFEAHVNDTLVAGDGLCDAAVVRGMVRAAPRLIERLLGYGVRFSREEDGAQAPFALGREGGHSRNRILHATDMTGRELEHRLLEACRAHPSIEIFEDSIGLDLITAGEAGVPGDPGRIVGCWSLDRRTFRRRAELADATILATGGCGKVYAYTSNPDIATGDGTAMAYRAGARLANLEFVQFHPTCLFHPQAKSFLISEAVRGEGAWLVNDRGERFMERYDPRRELAPRDVVARAIDQEMKQAGLASVFLDLRHLDRARVESRFPNLVKHCARFGIDMAGDLVPVVPAAHYMCGGVKTDATARTSLPGLYAVGEVAWTGVHGANRLASNSLLEAVYFADAASQAVIREPRSVTGPLSPSSLADPSAAHLGSRVEAMVLEHDWDSVRRVMWDYVGIVRTRRRLAIALDRLRAIRLTVEKLYRSSLADPDLVELRNIALMAELIVLSARERRESRGLHYTLDHPRKDDGAPRETLIERGGPLAAAEFDLAERR